MKERTNKQAGYIYALHRGISFEINSALEKKVDSIRLDVPPSSTNYSPGLMFGRGGNLLGWHSLLAPILGRCWPW